MSKKAGQTTLYTFFARASAKEDKKDKAAPAEASSTKTSPATTKPAQKDALEKWQKVKVNTRVSVYWCTDERYYDATVIAEKKGGSYFRLHYDDGEMEWLDLAAEEFRLLEDNEEEKKEIASKKRRRIQEEESDEEEFELDNATEEEENDNDDSYVNDPQDNDDDDEEEDQWMLTDDEEIIQAKKKPSKKKPRIQVTRHVSSSTNVKTPLQNSSKSAFTTPKVSTQTAANPFAALKSGGGSNKVTPTSSVIKRKVTPPDSSSSVTTTPSASPLPYVRDAVNPGGSHLHNHLVFLQNPKDAQGRTPSDALYNIKTLKVDYRELDRKQGGKNSKMSPAAKQWWEIKAQYFDTVLLFKTGKFYEMFHMDADIGVKCLNFCYMKGHVAHAGFPEISYGVFAERLVRAGYKVARVEQTETPQALKERNKKRRSGAPTHKVVNREVCSILTSGTRTFCYLDDDKGLASEEETPGSNNNGPLLAIREVLLEKGDENEQEVRPVCEYGIALVDAVRATVTIGEFADDVLRSRMNTLLTTFSPSEILVEGGENGASPTLLSLLRSVQNTGTRLERIHTKESFPKSTAVDPSIRKKMERSSPTVRPWDVEETLEEIHRRGYYPRGSRLGGGLNTSRWPKVLQGVVQGKAELALSSFGAALFYLQRNLIDQDVLGMGIVKAYVPPKTNSAVENRAPQLMQAVQEQQSQEDGFDNAVTEEESDSPPVQQNNSSAVEFASVNRGANEDEIGHLALDGTTIQNLEILFNAHSHTSSGSLWSKINHTKSPHGSRLLRAWLLRPLFRKADIERRADAVAELVSGGAAMSMSEARGVLAKCGDIERLLSRIHSMGGTTRDEDETVGYHPNERAVLYETVTHTKRKVGDFAKVLNGLRNATQIPEIFEGVEIQSDLLRKIVRLQENGGCFPDMTQELDWFFSNFDCELAAKGLFEPGRGVDEAYDEACDAIERIERELSDYQDEMCSQELQPAGLAKSKWKYINKKEDSKDKYLIELPVQVRVPDDFLMKGKRGKGEKQVNKYRTPVVEELVAELEHALGVKKVGKARGMQLVFAKFDSSRNLWEAAARATAMLDALGSLAQTSTSPGYSRPKILDCPPDAAPLIRIHQGRHPCVDSTHNGGEFIPNDLTLGDDRSQGQNRDCSRVLLLSGPNMGGKSTLLRQTCLIAILAQVGCYVPAEECALTPIDRIFTRLGATDRILLGQSTFFVELAETAAALRGATRRSLVCTDELGRGTSTFDGTAIASATVQHLVERNQCLALFATHYHSLLNDWKNDPSVRLGHMECIVEGSDSTAMQTSDDSKEEDNDENITFLYTLGEGACPKSFGINVARLAALPEEVLSKAKRVSSSFEAEMNGAGPQVKVTPDNALLILDKIRTASENEDWQTVESLWGDLQS